MPTPYFSVTIKTPTIPLKNPINAHIYNARGTLEYTSESNSTSVSFPLYAAMLGGMLLELAMKLKTSPYTSPPRLKPAKLSPVTSPFLSG
jgi:hypothetical protein